MTIKKEDIKDNDKSVSLRTIVGYYLEAKDKGKAIVKIAKDFNIDIKEVIELLNRFNIATPRIVSRAEVVDFNKSETKNNSKKKIKFDDRRISEEITVEKWFSEMGFNQKEGIEQIKVLIQYLQTQKGVNVFELFLKLLRKLIKSDAIDSLEDFRLEKFNVGGVQARIDNVMLEMTEKILSQPNPEQELAETKKKLVEKSMDLVKEGFKVIHEALHRPKPTLKPTPRYNPLKSLKN